MRLLLDTQALVLWLRGARMPAKTYRAIVSPASKNHVSMITPWEFVLKPQLRKTGVHLDHIWEGIGALNAEILPIRKEHILRFASLPFHQQHRDPFDRMLVAQALAEDLTLVGADTSFDLYRELKVLW